MAAPSFHACASHVIRHGRPSRVSRVTRPSRGERRSSSVIAAVGGGEGGGADRPAGRKSHVGQQLAARFPRISVMLHHTDRGSLDVARSPPRVMWGPDG